MSSEGITVYVGGRQHTNIQDLDHRALTELLNVCRMEIHNQELVMSRPGKQPDSATRYLATLKEREAVIRDALETRKSKDAAAN